MVIDKYVEESINSGIIRASNIAYLELGEDFYYIDNLVSPNNTIEKDFIFISIGASYRDFITLCEAFKDLNGAILKIFTFKKWGK